MRSTASVAKNIIPFNKCILETLLTTWVASGVASIFWGVAAATPCHPGSFATGADRNSALCVNERSKAICVSAYYFRCFVKMNFWFENKTYNR